jgi:site-specific recombinase XerD
MARQSNGNLVVVAQLMGHESVTTTQRYVGWTPDAAAVIDGMYGTGDDAA